MMNQLSHLASFTISLPPSVNHYTKRTRHGGVMLTDKARAYKREVYSQVGHLATREPSQARLAGEFIVHPANKRKFDLDNKMKLILDALEDARFFVVDEQFDEIVLRRGSVVKGGRVDVVLCEIVEGE